MSQESFWELYHSLPDSSLVDDIANGGEEDLHLQALARVNFEMGRIMYARLKSVSLFEPVLVDLARSESLDDELARMSRAGRPVHKLTADTDYLGIIRAHRISAGDELQTINLRRIRFSPQDRARIADAEEPEIKELQLELTSAAAQLNGAAEAALEDGDLTTAMLLAEAAGDFVLKGKTVIRANDNLTRGKEILAKIVEFVGAKPGAMTTFRRVASSIEQRINQQQAEINRFETNVLPLLGKPGDTWYRP